ncbi:hypothetical protein HMPREF9629_00609 [Peptoanaerobacter stomatis]|uniref:PF10934 family protein n=1 Tax=Peptoanaerobacter stomatis TaxID=796937 RepID=G9X2K2_9FIRM|nr:DUF2634 domain-containing protein [Peptoanaerobacter stomatis]EHL11072.1 hypothetical protein HMPREF9629_00609 [Peptoanaerobacter stomatis]
MIPDTDELNLLMLEGVRDDIAPSYTYRIHVKSDKVYAHIDDREALKQTIYKELNTQKDVYIIYPNYGIDIEDLFGEPKNFAYIELVRRIEECLIKDDRILSVNNFYYDIEKSKRDELSISFTVNSVYGGINIKNVWKFDYDNIGGD